MKVVITALLLGLCSISYAQKFSIKGQLTDSASAPMPSATVLLLAAKDSSLVNFGVTNGGGNFELKNVNRGDYLFKVTFVGFATHIQKVSLPSSGSVVDLGKIVMLAASTELQGVDIEAERAPVTIKRDTIEFNAGSFKTKQNAVVEDLLKKLPGVEVDNDGNITAQGEQVQRVTVDGKNFFGRDPKLATRNLPADAIDKVQVFDKKSDQAAFSGIDDGQREKTINLELKPEKRNGAFGNILAGAGTEDRFAARANINKFSKESQLSFLGMANNVNEQGFSMEEYMNFTGGSQQMMRGGAVRLEFSADNQNGVPMNFGNRANGIMTNYAAGVNLNNEFSKKTELNGSYFFNYLEHERDESTFRENFLPNGSFSFNQNSRQFNTNTNHRANFTLDQKIDSMNTLKLTGTITHNETDSDVRSTSETIGSDGAMENKSERVSLSNGATASLNSSLLWRHKFARKGRNFSTNLQFGYSDSDREGLLEANNIFYGGRDSTANLRQTNQQFSEYMTYSATLSYTEPLGGRKYLEGNYSYRQNLNDVERNVYDVNNGESIFNRQLSNLYSSDYQYHRAGLNFRIARNNYNLIVGSSIQKTNLRGDLKLLDSKINRSFENALPTVRFNYDFSNTKHVRFDYETSVQEPSIQQLQPVVDNSDPLNLYVGNPNLRPAYVQSWRANFATFDPASFVNFFAFVDVDYTRNAITNAQSINEQLVRLTTPVNVESNMRMTSDANFGFPINKLHSRFNVGVNYRQEQTLALLNDMENEINQYSAGGNIRYSYNYKEIVSINLSADVDRQFTIYEFNQPDQSFTNATYSAESNLTFLKNYQLNGSLEYLSFKNTKTNFSQEIPLLNISLSRFVMKNKSGEIKLSVNNLFDEALGVNQTATINYLERQILNSLGRYFMLSFNYALNKQLNPMGIRRGGGMMRIMR